MKKMVQKKVVYNRETLFDEVWEQPVVKVAEKWFYTKFGWKTRVRIVSQAKKNGICPIIDVKQKHNTKDGIPHERIYHT